MLLPLLIASLRIETLSGGQRQGVAVARAVAFMTEVKEPSDLVH